MTYELFSRRGAAPRQRDQLRLASVADVRSRERALRDRRSARISSAPGIPRSRRARRTAACGRRGPARAPKFVHVDARLSQTAANADEFVAMQAGHRRRARARHRARDRRQRGGDRIAARPNTRRRKWRSDRRAGREDRAAGARVRRATRPAVAIIGGAPLAHTNGLFHAHGGQHAQSRRRQRESAGRRVVHPAGPRRSRRERSSEIIAGRRAEGAARSTM